ncbi:MAG: C40 family peptidase [Candidatus Coproplasma sp.]
MKLNKTIIATAALVAAVTVSGCAAQGGNGGAESLPPQNVTDSLPPQDIESGATDNLPSQGADGDNADGLPESSVPTPEPPAGPPQPDAEEQSPQQPVPEEPPAKQTVSYIKVTGDGVNVRKGAGTSYASLGAAEKNTLYALLDKEGSWYKTYYKNSTAYISSKYCEVVEMERSDSDEVESVIAEGTRHMGTKYVYGATRYHDGTGKLLSGFTVTQFDCSSLVQYIFKKAVNFNLQVNTRTQVAQGKTVKRSELQRGDLIFFTNSSRKHLTGIERIGHVALYLGDNLILHTASDYAKIEEISSTRWSYYVQTQRMI